MDETKQQPVVKRDAIVEFAQGIYVASARMNARCEFTNDQAEAVRMTPGMASHFAHRLQGRVIMVGPEVDHE